MKSQNPNQGPGGPILIISSSANPFSIYYAEILRAEGLNLFAVADLSSISAATLASYDLVLLGQMPLNPAQTAMLSNWVNAGGNLIAMRPDKQLAGLLGLADAGLTLTNGYINVDTSKTPGYGIVGRPMQFHSAADLYTQTAGSTIATLYSTAAAATPYPAVTWRSVGAGTAAAFTYDLARSIVYTRQGNPAWSGQQRDPSTFTSSPNAPYNLYFGPAPFDPQPSWVDFNMVAVPQADEQQRLLANLIVQMNLNKRPLPRFWYFPFGFPAAVVMTGDDHANGGTAGRLEAYKAASNPGCSVANWECIRSTSYVYPNSPLTNAQAASYQNDGFEVALHVNTNCAPWTPATLDSFFASQLAAWSTYYPSVPKPVTNRTHCVVWSDYSTQPKVELARGIRLDTNYDYWPGSWVQDRPGLFTGSGMPMRFADVDGSIIDVYQATTYISDKGNQSEPLHIDSLLDQATGPSGYYGAFTILMHTDQAASFGSDVVITSAKGHGVPVISARQLLTWLDGRNNSYFGSLTWSGNILRFTIAAGQGTNGIQAMLPRNSSIGALTSLFLNGTPVAFTVKMIKGVEYAFFNASPGSWQATYGAPAVLDIVVSPQLMILSASQSQQFAATVTGSWNVGVNWTINPVVGSISSSGLYTAPASITSAQTVTVRATSASDPTRSATAGITLSPLAPPPSLPNPDGFWNMDYTYVIGSVVLDKSGNNMSGTISGGVIPVPGKLGQALSFNGVNGYISVADIYPVTQLYNNLTMAAWIRTSNSSRYETIISKYDMSGLESGYTFRTDPSGHVGVRIGSNNIMFGVGGNITDTGAAINDGQWHHVAAVITLGQGVQFYVDGSLSSNQPRNIITYPFGAPFQIGVSSYTPYGNHFTGSLDDVRFYRQALSASQIGQLANVPSNVLVSLSPLALNLNASQSQQFAAIVSGSANKAVIWSLNPNLGTISSTGLYTAPSTVLSTQNIAVTATSAADATRFATATITLTPIVTPLSVTPTVTPTSVNLSAGQTQQFTATVQNSANTGVIWSISPAAVGSISSTGLYTAPAVIAASQPITAIATSLADATKSGQAAITLLPPVIPVAATQSIWSSSTTPAVAAWADASPIEVGLKFRSDVAGTVTGVRFYKGPGNGGTHTGSLWSATGTLLAQGTFTNETASGWQQMTFPTPVPIAANTLYVVSYFAPQGYFAVDSSYFLSSGADNTPLHAPSSAAAAGNGVYRYSPVSAFPSQTYNGNNYWVDVLFSTAQAASIWSSSTTPAIAAWADASPIEVGLKFRSDVAGTVTGVRFYKGPGNGGTHTGSLWSATGTLLAQGTFTNETASGWQQMTFPTPVPITANTVYVVSYFAPQGYFAVDSSYFLSSGADNTPLHAPSSAAAAGNGVYRYTSVPAFPSQTYNGNNYWVDVLVSTGVATAPAPPVSVSVTPTTVNLSAGQTQQFTATVQNSANTGVTWSISPVGVGSISSTGLYTAPTTIAASQPITAIAASLADSTKSGKATITLLPPATPAAALSIWSSSTTPAVAAWADATPIEVGLKFRSDVAGTVTGVRFYKGPGNGGTHTSSLWSATGTLLAQGTFVNETASGWQQMTFPTPVPIAANTLYVVSYFAPQGRFALNSSYFLSNGADNAPLHAPSTAAAAGNGVFLYSPVSAFPSQTYNGNNYWVDMLFSTN